MLAHIVKRTFHIKEKTNNRLADLNRLLASNTSNSSTTTTSKNNNSTTHDEINGDDTK